MQFNNAFLKLSTSWIKFSLHTKRNSFFFLHSLIMIFKIKPFFDKTSTSVVSGAVTKENLVAAIF